MNSKTCPCISFLCAAKGNWRNAIFIECRRRQCGKQDPCPGFLLVPDGDGKPILVPADMVSEMAGVTIDPGECVAVVSRRDFEALYALWLEWHIRSPERCALTQATGFPCRRADPVSVCCFQGTKATNAY